MTLQFLEFRGTAFQMVAIDVAKGRDFDPSDFERRLGIHHPIPADPNDTQLQFLGGFVVGSFIFGGLIFGRVVFHGRCDVRPQQAAGCCGGHSQKRTTVSAKHGELPQGKKQATPACQDHLSTQSSPYGGSHPFPAH